MGIRDLIEQIAAGWPAYRQKVTVDVSDPTCRLITEALPRELALHTAAHADITVKGSTGLGNITAAPWIALLDRRVTTKATDGYYVVYLFSANMSTVTLCLAFGTTQFKEQFGSPENAFPRMRVAAQRLQEMFSHLIPARLMRGPIDLAAKPSQSLHWAYQQSAILSFAPYSIVALPTESQLISDLVELVQIYSTIASDPLEATVERLVEAVVEPVEGPVNISVRDFEIRPARKPRDVGSSGNPNRRRYSPESRKVGDAGERAVMDYECDRLTKLGRRDLADRVRWHTRELEFPGWDITSFDNDGGEIFIEVKSSIGKNISSVCLTVNEWDAACVPERRDRYYIYMVTFALSAAPHIERLRNPKSYVENAQLSCEAIVFELQLSSSFQ